MLRALRGFVTTRRALRALDRIALGIETQNVLLSRLADQFAPLAAPPEEMIDGVAKGDSSVSFLNERELGDALSYAARFQQQTGRTPTDEEIVIWLSEQAHEAHTAELNQRGRR